MRLFYWIVLLAVIIVGGFVIFGDGGEENISGAAVVGDVEIAEPEPLAEPAKDIPKAAPKTYVPGEKDCQDTDGVLGLIGIQLIRQLI